MNLLKDVQSHYKFKIFILHSTISLKEQMQVMRPSVDGSRYVVLATNIAESSLTVPNVEYVIDYCLCKSFLNCRDGPNMTYLSLEWSSKSSCDQRAGRTGRTNDGLVLRLVPYKFYQHLKNYDIPEFERIPLDRYVLNAKLIDSKLPPKMVLSYALNPPNLQDIESSILSLKRAGALTVYIEKKSNEVNSMQNKVQSHYDPEDGDLTSLGYIMSLLPLDIMLAKLVSLGLVFDVLNEAIIIAAAHHTSGKFHCNQNYKYFNGFVFQRDFHEKISRSNLCIQVNIIMVK